MRGTILVWAALATFALGCAGAAGDGAELVDAAADAGGTAHSPDAAPDATPHAAPDAGADAEPVTTCCRLDNDRGERLDYKCSSSGAFDTGYLEGRGYRCWLAQ